MMRKKFFTVTLSLVALVILGGCRDEAIEPTNESAVVAEGVNHWREDYAYSMGVAAMHYAYPYWRMAHDRYNMTQHVIEGPQALAIPNQMLNQYWHSGILLDATFEGGTASNNDALYSVAWVHVDDEPVVLTVPKMDRYFTLQLAGVNSDNFAYVGELATGRDGGNYALLPRGWQGQLPDGVTALAEVPSPWIMIMGRTYVSGPDDIPAVRKIQQQYRITPLSQLGQAAVVVPKPEVFKPYDKDYSDIDDPIAVWKTINRMLTENPPLEDEQQLMSLFREINIGPGMDVEALDEASKRGLSRAAVDGLAQIKQMRVDGVGSVMQQKGGWVYGLNLGRAGTNGDFLSRTVWQSYAGIVANDANESMYYGAYADGNGEPLDGRYNYTLTIPADGVPDVKAFWSITMYQADNNFVDNELNRYAFGDRTEGLVYAPNGDLVIALQAERPEDESVNWLPTPKGPFWMIFRAYLPGESLLNDEWQPQPVVREAL